MLSFPSTCNQSTCSLVAEVKHYKIELMLDKSNIFNIFLLLILNEIIDFKTQNFVTGFLKTSDIDTRDHIVKKIFHVPCVVVRSSEDNMC